MMKKFTLAHSPDSDDAFMFTPLANKLIDLDGLEFEEYLYDIETLNQYAFKSHFDISALSLHGFFYVQGRYEMLKCGASVGDKYGPIVVSSGVSKDIRNEVIAVPGSYTTATLVLKLYEPSVRTVNVKFDEIIPRVKAGEFKHGLIIHEGQLTYRDEGLYKVVDLGEWYYEKTGLPLVLGIVAIKKGIEEKERIEELITRSVSYSLANFEKIAPLTKKYARGLSDDQLRTFLNMYVNRYTIKFDNTLIESVEQLRVMADRAALLSL